MKPELSVVLPVHNQADHIAAVLDKYYGAFKKRRWEIILVPNGCRDDSAALCRKVAAKHPLTRVVEIREGGWGIAVRTGLQKARGRFLCYSNSARTDPATIVRLFEHFKRHPKGLAKVKRSLRGNWLRQGGSWIYNIECRLFLGIPSWDTNGTPKIFAASWLPKLSLTASGDFLDSELMVQFHRLGVPFHEIPLRGWARHGGKSLTNFKAAFQLYWEPLRYRQQMGSKVP
jgi:hypothetical protein